MSELVFHEIPFKNKKVIFGKKTCHHAVSITECDGLRTMVFGHGMASEQSSIQLNNLEYHVFDYSILSMHSLLFCPNPSKVLVVGLGGGVIPRSLSKYCPDAKIDVIEIDEDVIDLAKEYFYFEETDNVKVYHDDAFNAVEKLDGKYDIVILDAFNTSYTPMHLMSLQFFNRLKTILSDKSVVAINVCKTHPSYYSHVNTLTSSLGDDIYMLDGERNMYASMLFSIQGNIDLNKVPITDQIKKSIIHDIKALN